MISTIALQKSAQTRSGFNLKFFFGIFVQCSFHPAFSLRDPSQNARLSTKLEFFPPGARANTEKNRTYDYSP